MHFDCLPKDSANLDCIVPFCLLSSRGFSRDQEAFSVLVKGVVTQKPMFISVVGGYVSGN